MTIEIRQASDVTLLCPQGRMTLGGGDVALRNALTEALAAGSTKLLVNLSLLTYADSAGIGEIANCYKTVSAQGGRFIVCDAQPAVRQLLKVTRLDQVFETHDTEAEALAAF